MLCTQEYKTHFIVEAMKAFSIFFFIYHSALYLQLVIRLSKYIAMIEHDLYIHRKQENALFTIY